MLETFTSVSSSYFIHTSKSPHTVDGSRRSTSSLLIDGSRRSTSSLVVDGNRRSVTSLAVDGGHRSNSSFLTVDSGRSASASFYTGVYSDESLRCPVPTRHSSHFVSWRATQNDLKRTHQPLIIMTTDDDVVQPPDVKKHNYDLEACNELEEILQNHLTNTWATRIDYWGIPGTGNGASVSSETPGRTSLSLQIGSMAAAINDTKQQDQEESTCDPNIDSEDNLLLAEDDEEDEDEETKGVSSSNCIAHHNDDNFDLFPFDPTLSPLKMSDPLPPSLSGRSLGNTSSSTTAPLPMFPSITGSSTSNSPSTERRKRRTTLRPKLGNSTSSLSFASFASERPDGVLETPITPPVRVPNPLPLNLATGIGNFRESQGPEFGLLSVSPPSRNDEDTLLRRSRVMSFAKQSHNENDIPISSTIGSHPPSRKSDSRYIFRSQFKKASHPASTSGGYRSYPQRGEATGGAESLDNALPPPPPISLSNSSHLEWNECDILF